MTAFNLDYLGQYWDLLDGEGRAKMLHISRHTVFLWDDWCNLTTREKDLVANAFRVCQKMKEV
jgi:hypothetical protein